MTSTQDLIFVQQQERSGERLLTTSFSIAAPLTAVWEALTTEEGLTNWFPFQAKVEPGPDGSVWLSWDGTWEDSLAIHAWEENKHLRTGWGFEEFPNPVYVDYFLEPGPENTTLFRLVHHGFSAEADWDELIDGTRRGWSFELRSLRHYLEHHSGKRRYVVKAQHPIPGSPQDAWGSILSADGLLREGGFHANLAEGSRYSITTASGDVLSGTIVYAESPRDLALSVDEYEQGLLRLSIDKHAGLEAGDVIFLGLSTWGLAPDRTAGLAGRWTTLLRSLFGALG